MAGLLTTAEIVNLNTAVEPWASRLGRGGLGTVLNDLDVYRNPSGAQDYYVDLNRSVTQLLSADGLTWDTAYGTIAAAIAASNISIGLSANRWWARRNRIFVVGDGITESLTVLPEKCDIIGLGSDLYPYPRVTGVHVIAVAKVACRFINMGFNASAVADIFDIPAGCHGIQWLGCTFVPTITGATKAIEIDDAAGIVIKGCNFQIGGGGPGYFTLAIDIEGTIHHDCLIADNKIIGVAGIQVSDAAANCFGSSMERNTVRATTGLPIDDDSDDWMMVDNRMITQINIGTTTAGYDFNLELASGNILTGLNGVAATIPFAVTAE